MAVPAGALNLLRSATLLRFQRVREDRTRVELARAEREHGAALVAERAARQACEAHELARAEQVRNAHGALRGRVIDPMVLDDLAALEGALQTRSAGLANALAEARTAVRNREGGLAVARDALKGTVRTTRKRERLDRRVRAAWDRASDAAEETERDEAVADRGPCASAR